MIWRSISYDWPSLSLLLFIVPFVAWAFVELYRFRQTKLQAFADKHILNVLVENRFGVSFWTKVALLCLVLICSILSLMQPKGNQRYIQQNDSLKVLKSMRKQMHEVIFLFDASASMDVKDVSGRTRLAAAKEIADDIVSHLDGENVALFAFAATTIQIVPMTADYLFTRLMIRQLEINEGENTNLKQALETVNEQFFLHSSPIPKTLILLTDGGDTLYESLDVQTQVDALNKILQPISNANDKNMRIIVVGLGTKKGGVVPNVQFNGLPVHSSLDQKVLKRISTASKGRLFLIEEQTAMEIAQEISADIAKRAKYEQSDQSERGARLDVYDMYFQYPLGIALLALVLYMLIPDTRKIKRHNRIYHNDKTK